MKSKLLAATFILALTAGGCVSPEDEDLQGDDLKLDTQWEDLIGDRGAEFEPHFARELEEITLTPERLAALPVAVKAEPDLARFAVTRFLNNPSAYEGGVYGLVGTAKVFVAPTKTVKDYDRLYWVMVKVLSEKYGCFMTMKQNRGTKTWIKCRDGRQVMFWRARGPDWIQFHARQYDSQGYEIVVRSKQIVRIGRDKFL